MSLRIDPPLLLPQVGMKQRLSELALLGGPKLFREPLHVGRPNVVSKERMLARIGDILDRAWLTNDGQVVRQFEEAVARYAAVRHCVAVANGTLALQIAAQALELRDEAVVPSLTFVATPHALHHCQVRPIFADVDPCTWTLSACTAEARLSSRTTGLVGVHLWGQVCDVAGLEELASRRGLRLLFDASHALGCTHHGVPVGGFGDAETISFHATKFVNAAEGGAILTNDDQLAHQMRHLRNFGFRDPGTVVAVGTNAKLSEIHAAIGLTSLEHADQLIELNQQNHVEYQRTVGALPGISIRDFNLGERCNHQYVVAQVKSSETGLSRDDLMALLRSENVLARRYFYPGCHRMDTYREANASLVLPTTEDILEQVLILPTGIAIGPDEIAGIARILQLGIDHADLIRHALRSHEPETAAAVEAGGVPSVAAPNVALHHLELPAAVNSVTTF